MRGLYLDGGSLRYREDLAEPSAAPGEVRVRVTRAGICATDLALKSGYMGFRGVPGHEFVGVALEGPLAGRRVVGEINAGCARCAPCAAGDPRHCTERSVLGILARDGAFAETLRLPAVNLHLVPDGVSDDAATFSEPLAAAFRIPEVVELEPGMRALVCGDGRLGLLCARVLALHGLDVTVAGRHPERLALIASAPSPGRLSHATGLVESDAERPSSAERCDLVVEATGDPEVFARALAWTRPRGVLVLKTTAARPAELDLAPLVVDEIRVEGSRCGPFGPALAALAEGSVDVERLISDRFALRDGALAFHRAAEGGVLKVLLAPSDDE